MSQIVLHLKVIKLLLTELTANVSRRDIPGLNTSLPGECIMENIGRN